MQSSTEHFRSRVVSLNRTIVTICRKGVPVWSPGTLLDADGNRDSNPGRGGLQVADLEEGVNPSSLLLASHLPLIKPDGEDILTCFSGHAKS
jgi:hypothetical protein